MSSFRYKEKITFGGLLLSRQYLLFQMRAQMHRFSYDAKHSTLKENGTKVEHVNIINLG